MNIPLQYGLIAYTRLPAWKYELSRDYQIQTQISPFSDIRTAYLVLTAAGLLTIRAGYRWDGPSGPTYDDASNMRGSLVHDALYQLMREGWLDRDRWRQPADQILYDLCRADGMPWLRARAYYRGVQACGHAATMPRESTRIVYMAP